MFTLFRELSMSRPPATAGNTRKLVALGFTAAVLGCQPSNAPAPERIKLPPGVDGNATIFKNSIQGYSVRVTRDRPRPGNCSKCLVMIHIEVLNVPTFDPDQPPSSGKPIAHLVNADATDTEAYFNLLPGNAAEYYMWVDDAGGRKSRATLLQVAGNSVTATRQWNIRLCHRESYGPGPRPADFDFYEFKHGSNPCDAIAATGYQQPVLAGLSTTAPVTRLFTLFREYVSNRMEALRGDWIECSSGCCT